MIEVLLICPELYFCPTCRERPKLQRMIGGLDGLPVEHGFVATYFVDAVLYQLVAVGSFRIAALHSAQVVCQHPVGLGVSDNVVLYLGSSGMLQDFRQERLGQQSLFHRTDKRLPQRFDDGKLGLPVERGAEERE